MVDTVSGCATTGNSPEKGNLTVSLYSSRDDLISAILGSGYLPPANAPACTTSYKGYTVIDGTYSIPLPCPADNAQTGLLDAKCLRIAAFPEDEWPLLTLFGAPDVQPITQADIYPGVSADATEEDLLGNVYAAIAPCGSTFFQAAFNPACLFSPLVSFELVPAIIALANADSDFYLANHKFSKPSTLAGGPPPSGPHSWFS